MAGFGSVWSRERVKNRVHIAWAFGSGTLDAVVVPCTLGLGPHRPKTVPGLSGVCQSDAGVTNPDKPNGTHIGHAVLSLALEGPPLSLLVEVVRGNLRVAGSTVLRTQAFPKSMRVML